MSTSPDGKASSKLVSRKKIRGTGIYNHNILTRTTSLPFNVLGSNIRENIELVLKETMEGKCVKEGYIKPDSIRIISYSAGLIKDKYVLFEVAFECLICRPVEGQKIRCMIKNITKAGIRAEHKDKPSPMIIFIARDHQFNNKYFSKVKESDDIMVRIIGIRYELNDKYISAIAELLSPKKSSSSEKRPKKKKGKVKIVFVKKDNKK